MRRHTLIGERILEPTPGLAGVAALVRASHERPDGSGYPDGLAGEAIPFGARIVAVCDAYDAMVSDRPYRRGMPPATALRSCARAPARSSTPPSWTRSSPRRARGRCRPRPELHGIPSLGYASRHRPGRS